MKDDDGNLQLSTLSKVIIIFLIIVIGSTVIKVLRDLKVSGAGLLNIPMVMAIFYVGKRPNPKLQADTKHESQKREPTVEIDGFTQLMFAAREGDLVLCKQLIDQGVDINEQDDKGATALIYAVLSTNEQTVKLLIDNGADKRQFTKKGLTALAIAKNNKMKNIIGILS